MGLFGGGIDKSTRQYNNQLMDYQKWAMGQNQGLANEAKQYVNMGPESDIAYDTASGSYLNSNPYINNVAGNVSQQIIDQYNRSTIPSALSSYAGSGRFGSGLFQKTLADTQSQMNQDVGNAMNNLYYGNYNQERQNQEAARNRIASQYDPLNRYSSYSGMINQYNPGSPQALPAKGSVLGGVLQGAMSGASAGAAGGPWGMAAGAAGGGLIGGLSQ